MTIYTLDNIHPDIDPNGTWVAPNAVIIGNVKLCRNSSVWFNAILRGDNDLIVIGQGSNVQDGAILHTDPGIELRVGNDVTIGHQANLHGCIIGDNTLVGIGATILNHAKIGKNCLIGAHALITEGKHIPDNSLVMGAPGKIIKKIEPDIAELLGVNAKHYVSNAQRYSKHLQPV